MNGIRIREQLALERRVRLELDRHTRAAAPAGATVAVRGRPSRAGLPAAGRGRLGSRTARASSTASAKE